MSPDSRKYLWDATEAAQRILRFTSGKTFADYSQDELLRAAIERHFIILGEALSRLRQVDAETANQLPDLARTVALRNLKGGEQKVMPLAEAAALIKADATPPDLR